MSMTQHKVEAREVREGDFIPGLDNGYVFEDPEEGNGHLSYPSTSYGVGVAMPEDTILIGFHTAEGDEAFLLCPPNMPITVARQED